METFLTKENVELITFSIAIIGCLTGCFSLLINLYRLYRERYCLKIQYLESECFYFDAITTKKYSTKHQAILHITIRNKSIHPITIHDAKLYVNGCYTRFEEYTDSNTIKLPETHTPLPANLIDPMSYVTIPVDRQFKTPLRLQACDSFEGIAFIPCFPYAEESPIKVTVIYETAKRSEHKTTVLVHKFDN